MTITLALQIVFWTASALVVYTYVGYPVLVWFVSVLRPKTIEKQAIEPTVTILITAYNEEASIGEKLNNTLEIEYPSDRLEILVASDGSDDRTHSIVEEFKSRGVRLFVQPGRKGKTYTQNKAVEVATGEIIVFSDATTLYKPNVLRKILSNFFDDSVGCVAGRLVYVDPADSSVGSGAKGYWSVETKLKQFESRACSLIGASGCLYAVRRKLYEPMYPDACSDFLICTNIYSQGKRSVFEPEAVCTEVTNKDPDKEFAMRIRVISQTFNDLWKNARMMNPIKSGFYGVQLISHKLFRYLIPLFLLLILYSSAILSTASTFFTVLVILQLIFYSLAVVGLIVEKFGVRSLVFSIPMYFVLTSAASTIGFYKFVIGERYRTWEPIRDEREEERAT